MSGTTRRWGALGFTAALIALACGCETEKKVVRQRGWLSGLPGTVHNDPEQAHAGENDEPAPPTRIEDLEITNPDGSLTLRCPTIRVLMIHLVRTLDKGDERLLHDQVLSDVARQHYRNLGRQPGEILAELRAARADLDALLARMPAAEQTPGVFFERGREGQYRLRLTGQLTRGLRLTEFWVDLEGADWKFVAVR